MSVFHRRDLTGVQLEDGYGGPSRGSGNDIDEFMVFINYYYAHRRPFDSGCIAFIGDSREVLRCSTPVRYYVHACEVHACEVHACEVHACEVHACEMHACEIHACELRCTPVRCTPAR
jgi:hypothetical protein